MRGAIIMILLWPVSATADRRVALVIGNADYRNMPRLSNPRNDAEDVAKSLRELGSPVALNYHD